MSSSSLTFGIAGEQLLEAGALLERLVQRHVERRRDQLGDLVDVGERHVEDAADVADHGLRLHRPEGDDLGDVLAAVLAGDVVDDLAAAALAEVDVDIRQRDALGVEEALEDQVELDRIDVGDLHAPRDHRAGRRSAARADRDAGLAREADEIPHDQEVPRVLHLLDHGDFVDHAPLVLVERVAQGVARHQGLQPRQPRREALAHHVLEVGVDGEAGRHVEVGQVVHARRQVDVDAIGDPHRVGQRVRELGEDLRHRFRRLQEELIAVIAQPIDVVHRLAGADAEQDVVRLVVVLAQVVHVVGAHHRQAEVAGDAGQAAVHDLLLVEALVLQLEEEVVGAEDVAVRRRRGAGLLQPILVDAFGDLALETARQADEALAVLREQVLVDARLVVEAFRVAGRDQLDQVVEAFVGLGQQHQVVGRLARRPALGAAIARRDVDLAAEDRLDALLPRVVVEGDRREHVAVLGDGERGHAQLLRLVEQLLDAAGAIEQRELRVEVEMDEVTHWALPRCRSRSRSVYSHSIVDGGFELMS